MSTRSSLHDEVDGLLETTSQLLSQSRDRALSESGWGNSPGRLDAGGHSTASAYGRQTSVRSTAGAPDALEAAAARLRSSFDSASRKLAALKKTTSFKEPLSVNIPNSASDDEAGAPTPRLDGSPGRFGGSVALTERSAPILERSASMSSPGAGRYSSAGGARTYNSFAGLQNMVSMVDDLVSGVDVVHSSPRADRPSGVGLGLGLSPSTAGSRHGAGSTVSGSRLGGSMLGVGLSKDIGRVSSPSGILRPPSRLGSPAMLSPRSPASRKSVIPPPAPGTKVPRRTQLQALLQKDLAAPYEVVKFKTEVSSHSKAPAGLPSLQGNLQERFDRVNRKLKNWELVETAATEKFNAAMEAALDAIFSKIKVSWPPSDRGAGKASASRKEEERSRKSSRSGRSTTVAQHQDGSDGRDSRHARSHAKAGRAEEASGEEMGSLSSQGSGRGGRRGEASTTSDISEDGRSTHSGSSRGSEGSGRDGYHRTGSRGKGRDTSKGRSGDVEEDRRRQLQNEKPGRDKRDKGRQRAGGDYQQQHDRQQHPQQLWYEGPPRANGFPGGMGAASAALHGHGYGGSGSRQVHPAAVHPGGPYAPSYAPPHGAQPSPAPAHDGSYASPSSPSPGPYPMRVRHEYTGAIAASPGGAPSSHPGQGPSDGGYVQGPQAPANQEHWGHPWPSSALKSLQNYGSPGPLPPSAYADRMQPAGVSAASPSFDHGGDYYVHDGVAARPGAESYRGSLASSGVQYYRPPPQLYTDGEQGAYSPTYHGSFSVQPDHAYGPPGQLAPSVRAHSWQQTSTQRPHIPYMAGAGPYQMHAYQVHAGYRGPGL